MLVQELSVHRKVLDKPLELLVRRVGQLYDFQLNMWQFATAPQAAGGPLDAPKELLGGPLGGPPGALQAAAGAPKACAEGEQQKAPLQQEGEALLLSQVVQPGVYRQLGGAVEEEEQQAAAAAAAVAASAPAVAAPAATAAIQQQ
ncbi:transcriptional co-activator ADA2-A, putative [Eimeria necatrix]|uniref:Transcriptional co-activator ADA2-A, putative n=1 Tax=Eimeria necatrix TaxID=51315 RepID=U6MQT2_9EIME|nr:transcriptional co-activator ADA2-A, putative [Eimeria necatrix]CDJ64839.1 transcriptional co-activator ADA2-A, putative [Eimeria necatrix]